MKRFAVTHLSSLVLLVFLFSPGLSAQTVLSAAPFSQLAVYPGISATAIVVSLEEADLSARITAKVSRVAADVGARVQAGETLVTLECDDYELALRMAQARLEGAGAELMLAQNRHRRTTTLLERELAAQENFDATAAGLAATRAERRRAEAAVDIASLDKSRCDVKAPFDGTVTARYVSRGQLAGSGTPLLRLVNHRQLEVSARISERDLDTFDGETDFTFNGLARYPLKLTRTVQALDRQTRTQEVRLRFTGEQPLPGSAGRVTWKSSVPHIPREYLRSRNGLTGYFTADSGVAEFVPLGRFPPEKAYPSAAPPDTVIITEGLEALESGAPVSVRLNSKPSGSGADQ